MTNFLAIMISGLLASNCLVSTCSGIDITTNRLKDLKNASIYSLVVFCVLLASSLALYVCNLILEYYGLTKMLFLVALVCVAGFVQVADYVTKKIAPRFYAQVGYFLPILACNLFLLVLTTSATNLSFGYMLLHVLFNGLGIWFVLSIIAGIKQNYFTEKKGTVNANIASLVIVFILIIIWTAF